MVIEISIPTLPCSINRKNQRSKNGTIILSNEYRESKKFISTYLIKYKQDFLTFRELYERQHHYIKLMFKLYRKNSSFWTKKGTISLTSGDTDNYKKLFKDCLFEHLELNDAIVCSEQIIKLPANTDYMTAIIKLCNVDDLKQNKSFF